VPLQVLEKFNLMPLITMGELRRVLVGLDSQGDFFSLRQFYHTGRAELRKISWKIEEFHRGVKQFYGIERCQARKRQSQFSHILLSIRAFLVFERARLTNGTSWYESKMRIHRAAVVQFIENPSFF